MRIQIYIGLLSSFTTAFDMWYIRLLRRYLTRELNDVYCGILGHWQGIAGMDIYQGTDSFANHCRFSERHKYYSYSELRKFSIHTVGKNASRIFTLKGILHAIRQKKSDKGSHELRQRAASFLPSSRYTDMKFTHFIIIAVWVRKKYSNEWTALQNHLAVILSAREASATPICSTHLWIHTVSKILHMCIFGYGLINH